MTAQRLILPFDSDTRWQELGLDLRVAACSDAPLLITGSRDAARLVARTIHDRSPRRRSAPFTIGQHKTLFETLASLSIQFRTAHGSTFASTADHAPATLYIDEVDRLTPDAQEILMYFLEVTHGSPAANQSVRLVTATTGDLADRVAAGEFREDLFYRLNVVHLALPKGWGANGTQIQALLSSLPV